MEGPGEGNTGRGLGVHFRLATTVDLPALAQMRWDFRAEDGETPRESFEAFRERYVTAVGDWMRDGRLTYWVADTGTALIAHMAIVRVPGIPRPTRASDQWGYLTDCYTRPAFRSAHVGGTLLQQVQRWARHQDFELLLVAPSEGAERFYRRAGFAEATTFRECRLRPFDDESAPGTHALAPSPAPTPED